MLHLVGVLFPHINDDARSKSHQIRRCVDRKGRSREVGRIIRSEIGTKWRGTVRKISAEE